MRKELLFSIIIPIYNTPIAYLEKAIKSVSSQVFEDYELLLINDGSDSKYAHYLDTIEEKNEKITVIHKKNGGVSSARNLGIVSSQGKYIVFVDADDEISRDFLNEAAHYINEYVPDIVYGSIKYVPGKPVIQSNDSAEVFIKKDFAEVKKALLNIQPRKIKYSILGTPCGRIYKAEHVKKVLFEEGVPLCEDQLFNRKILEIVDTVLVVPNTWYSYIQNDFSAMHAEMKKSYFNMAKPYWDVLVHLNQKENPEIRHALSVQTLGLYYTVIQKDYIAKKMKLSKKVSAIAEISKHPLIKDAIYCLKNNASGLSLSQKFGLFLVKHNMFITTYLAQYFKYR